MDILAYCAVNPARRFPEAEQTIRELEGVKARVFDGRDDLSLPWYDRVLEKYRAARRMTLSGEFDALLTCESDMLIPKDAPVKLAEALKDYDAGVVYGLYVLRHGVPMWSAFVALDEEAGFSLSDPLARENAPNEWRGVNAGLPFEIYGAGFGCTLIRRDVLEQLDFRNWGEEKSFYVDWLLAADCNARGIRQMCDPRVTCGHINDQGQVLYPDLTQQDLCRAEYLRGFEA